MTPNKYINQLRVDHAKDLIANSNRSMTDIALSCGFGDSNYFARMFKQVEGVSPRQYRKSIV